METAQPSPVLEGTLTELPQDLRKFEMIFDVVGHPQCLDPKMLQGQLGDVLETMGFTYGQARAEEDRFIVVPCFPHGQWPVDIPMGKRVIDRMVKEDCGFYIKPSN